MSDFKTKAATRRQTLTFDGKSSKDFLLYLSGPGVYDAPKPDVETISVPGMNGDLLQNNAPSGMRRFENVDIKYEAFFFDGLPAKTAAVKSWLLSPAGYAALSDSFDADFFRMATCSKALSFDVSRGKAATMEIIFSCKPQRFSYEGQEEVSLTSSGKVLSNPYEFYAQPLITVYGTGQGEICIGDRTVTIYSFDEYVVLDCETQNAYNADGFCNNTIFSEDFPLLAPGENEITWSGAITSVKIVPRWWTL